MMEFTRTGKRSGSKRWAQVVAAAAFVMALATAGQAEIHIPVDQIIEQAKEAALKPPPPKPVDVTRPNHPQVLKAFADYMAERDDLTDAQRTMVAERLAEAGADPSKQTDVMTHIYRKLHGDFDAALDALADERTERAINLLDPITQNDDPYLAAHAQYYAARAAVMDEDYESARGRLELLTGPAIDKTTYSGEALFMLGVAQAELLDRPQAILTLKEFCIEYPDSSERMVIGAIHLIEELAAIEDGRLSDVGDRMDFSRRRLDLERTEDRTQGEQQRVVAMLDKLIEEAEQKENSGGGGGGGGGGGQGQGPAAGNAPPSGPANQSQVSPGEARIGNLHRVNRGDPADTWGNRPDREREEVLNAIKARFPQRYRELIEQYYKSLQDERR